MGTLDTLLQTPEVIGAAAAGLVTVGLIVRAAVKGWVEAKAQANQIGSNTAAMLGAVSIGFERDQRELLVQGILRLAEATEMQSASQESIANALLKLAEIEQRELKESVSELLERMKNMPELPHHR